VNYRHAFHAGNFADLVKHAAVILILDSLVRDGAPVLVVDSHAGAGMYDLGGELARKSGEAQAGVERLMADAAPPAALGALKAAVRRANPDGALRLYPGSPALIAGRLRPADEYVGAELRADDFEALSQALAGAPVAGRGRAGAVRSDGFDLVRERAGDRRRLFVLIDPPFEQPDDYARTVDAVAAVLARPQPAVVLVWLPLKDLETFDSFVRQVEALEPASALAVEARLMPLTDPMKMNGCALVILNPPAGVEAPLLAAAQWVTRSAGGPGGLAKVWRLGG
jgi:23S rRNA (adenine2030-N6)-methyltransferase